MTESVLSTERIARIRVRELGYLRAGGSSHASTTQGQYWLSTPTSRFPDGLRNAKAFWGPVSVAVVEIETESGLIGYGTAGSGNAGNAALIEEHLAPMLIGENPTEVERLWDRMYRATVRFGRRGTAVAAISGLDIALWDLKGKILGVPVVDLLGGRHHDTLPAYASRLYAMKNLDELAVEASGYREQGFRMVKQRFGFGPADGEAGIRKNVELVRTVREAVGEDVSIAGDAYMSWTAEYAIRMERELRPYRLAWIEEALLPHDVQGYQRLCSVSETQIAHGEHSWTKWDFVELIQAKAVHVLQPDMNRVGGITEGQKIYALAEAFDLPVIPHSNEIHNLHLSFAKPNAPWAEYFPYRADDPGGTNTIFWEIFDGNPLVEQGTLRLTDAPGLGLALNPEGVSKLERRSTEVTARSIQ